MGGGVSLVGLVYDIHSVIRRVKRGTSGIKSFHIQSSRGLNGPREWAITTEVGRRVCFFRRRRLGP